MQTGAFIFVWLLVYGPVDALEEVLVCLARPLTHSSESPPWPNALVISGQPLFCALTA